MRLVDFNQRILIEIRCLRFTQARRRRQSYSLKSQPAVFEARRRRQSYLRHGGHAIFFGKLQFSRTEATKCHFYNAITVV
jgi:hypothetical protein